jgi:8-oxo-dGTP pyrophosphatase MutT (NUDIX family)
MSRINLSAQSEKKPYYADSVFFQFKAMRLAINRLCFFKAGLIASNKKQGWKKMLQEKSCGAVIFLNQDSQIKYLLLCYSANHWGFVKGGVEANESEKETVIRELKEETGITDAKFTGGFRESIEYFYHRQDVSVHKTVVFYLMEVYSEKVELSFEHKGYLWLDYDHAIKMLSFNNSKDVLDKAHNFLMSKVAEKKSSAF